VKVRVERAGNRILLGSDQATSLKAIPGSYFRQDKTWSLPLDLETCQMLRDKFGSRLEIGPTLWAWAKAEKAHRETMVKTAVSLDAELKLLPEVAPVLAEAMQRRTYQRVAARYIADTRSRDGRRRTLIADTVGLGKTAEALAGILEAGTPGPHLIVCPKTAVNSTWSRQINRWLPGDEVITLPEAKAERKKVLETLLTVSVGSRLEQTWVVVHPYAIRTQTWWDCGTCDSLTKYTTKPIDALDCGHPKGRNTEVRHEHVFPQLFDLEWGSVTVDESDQILIRLTGTPNLQRRGAELLRTLVRQEGVLLALSGTPHRSKPHQVWSTLNWLDPVRWSGKWRWIAKYWETVGGTFGGTTIGDFKEDREAMYFGELSDVMLRRTRDDVRGDLPPKLYAGDPLHGVDAAGKPVGPIGVWLPMEKGQERAYRQMEKTATATIEGGEISAIGVLAEMTRLKQFACAPGVLNAAGEFTPKAGGNKFDWLVEFLISLGFPDKPSTKVVFASQFTTLLNAFRGGVERSLKLDSNRTGAITGEVTGPRRDAYVTEFEDLSSPLDLLFINTKAGGSSITLDAAEVMIIDDETWEDHEQEQLEGRIDNREPERRIVPRTYYYLRSLGTIEESIAEANAEAKAEGKRILDGMKPAALASRFLKGHS
jgi:hypothetical protein